MDFSIPLDSSVVVYAGDKPFACRTAIDFPAVSELLLWSHTGTHVDAQRHFLPDGQSVDQLPLATLLGRVFIAILSEEVLAIEAAHLEAAAIPTDAERVFLRTGNSSVEHANWPREPFRPRYTYLTAGAAQWLVDRGVQVVGIDYLSVDSYEAGEDSSLPAHRILLATEEGMRGRQPVVIVESLDLTRVRDGGWYEAIVAPMFLRGGDGAPCRVMARPLR